MRDELCRFCGADLTNFSICPECRKPVRRICTKCTRKTEEHLHLSCLSGIDFLQTQNQYANNSVSDNARFRIAEIA
jgi:predicted amidophosphoribosyltransferase